MSEHGSEHHKQETGMVNKTERSMTGEWRELRDGLQDNISATISWVEAATEWAQAVAQQVMPAPPESTLV